MKAVWIKEYGEAKNLEIRETDEPAPPAGSQVLVGVKTAGLNRADLLQVQGRYRAPGGYTQDVPGMEFAGEVAAIGENVTKFEPGDRVFGIIAGGAQAEQVLTQESALVKIPRNLNFIEAAGIPEVFITAHDAVFTQAGLRPGETLLIHAVGSGVGLAALQLAKAAGAITIGTSRTAGKLEQCKAFGLDHGVLAGDGADLAETIANITDNKGVEVILDLVGAVNFAANLKSLGQKGRMMLVGLTGGANAEFNLGLALSKRAKIIGTVLRGRSDEEKARATQAFAEEVVPLLASGAVAANIDKVFALNDVRDAYEYLASNASFGKVILRVQD